MSATTIYVSSASCQWERHIVEILSLPVHPLAGQRVGYARISGPSQNLDGQTDALNAAGCQKIFADTASGKLTERPELTLCLGYLRAGDTLVVWRLGRSLRHLVETVNALAEHEVAFASLHGVLGLSGRN
jgi:DNA invertase Pin-like site-specific DNA recombinase